MSLSISTIADTWISGLVSTALSKSKVTTRGERPHVNPLIRSMMQCYYDKYNNRASMKPILEAVNVTIVHPPMPNRYMKGRKNTMCYLHVLCICSRGFRCHHYSSHTAEGGIPDRFTAEMVQKIKPGVDYCCHNAAASTAKQWSRGGGGGGGGNQGGSSATSNSILQSGARGSG
jgi:hypothetical protein